MIRTIYWLYRAYRDNKPTLALIRDLMLDVLERSLDAAFGGDRSKQDRNERLARTIDRYFDHVNFDRTRDRNSCPKIMADSPKYQHNPSYPNRKRLSIQLPIALHDRLISGCSQTGLQKSAIVRAALSEYLDNLAQKEPRRSA